MTLIRRSNSKNWYYQFQIQGKKYFGTTGTQNKTKAAQVEREMRNRAHGELFLGDAPPITIKPSNDMWKPVRTCRITRACVPSSERHSATSCIHARKPSCHAMGCHPTPSFTN